MEYIIDFFTTLGIIYAFLMTLLFIGKLYTFIKKREPIKFSFTKEKLWGMGKSLLHLTTLIFLLKLAIKLDGLWWLLFLVYMFVTDKDTRRTTKEDKPKTIK